MTRQRETISESEKIGADRRAAQGTLSSKLTE
jgi:hypothetical protein